MAARSSRAGTATSAPSSPTTNGPSTPTLTKKDTKPASSAICANPGAASASPTSGVEHFHLVFTSADGPGCILARGPVFTAGGTDYRSGFTGLAVFTDGAFTIIHYELKYPPPTINPRTCVIHQPGSGKYKLARGYRAYQHITGSGSVTFATTATFPRKANHTCAFKSAPIAVLTVGNASGPVTLH